MLDDETPLRAIYVPDLLGGATTIRGETSDAFQAVPSHLWNHRGNGPMAVWPRRGQSGNRE